MTKHAPTRSRWWERFPGRLEFELEQLDDLGFKYTIDEDRKATGALQLTVEYPDNGKVIPLTITFPDLYPYFRFAITAPTNIGLLHHQAPFTGDVCVIGRATRLWSPTDTVGSILHEQMPKVLAAGRAISREDVPVKEEEQAEPFTDYFLYAPNAMFVIDGGWAIGERNVGEFAGAIIGMQDINDIPTIRGVVLQLANRKGKPFGTAHQQLRNLPWSQSFRGRWSRLNEPPNTSEAKDVWEQLEASGPKTGAPDWNTLNQSVDFQVRAAVFPEENAHRKEEGEGWLFVIHWRRKKVNIQEQESRFRNPFSKRAREPGEGHYLARAGRMGEQDLSERIPELARLRSATVVVVGTGCIGGPSVIEFARAQVGKLEIVDGDYFDPATSPRWPLGLIEAGRPKALSLFDFVRFQYPFTQVAFRLRRFGTLAPPGEDDDDELLRTMLENGSLLYDATAEVGVQQMLADYARNARIPYVAVTGTNGGWGGRVARIRPGKTAGCWMCLQKWLDQGEIPTPPGIPESQPGFVVQPGGCADPTFTGAGFDMASIALIGVRIAMQTISEGGNGSYPDVDWDVATVSFRDESGQPIAPKVETSVLRQHPECPNCANI